MDNNMTPGLVTDTTRAKPPITFLSLPCELRQQILHESFEGCWKEFFGYGLILYANGKWAKDLSGLATEPWAMD